MSVKVPKEIKKYYDYKMPVPFDLYLKYKNGFNTKRDVEIKCEICKEKTTVKWHKISTRKYHDDRQICNKCVMKATCNDNMWKKTNSKAQIIAQNRPETKKKMSEAIINKMVNDKNCRIGMYNTLKGVYKNIPFDSSYELSFILYAQNILKINIKRCKLKIPYMINNEIHNYLPDFQYDYEGKTYIVEIKSKFNNTGMTKNKKNALEKYGELNNIICLFYDYYKLLELDKFEFLDTKNKVDKLEGIGIFRYPKGWL